MIRILAINGSPVKGGNTAAVIKEALSAVSDNPQVETKTIELVGLEIRGCRHCNWCVKNQTAAKFCAISDGMDELYAELIRSDAVVLSTPVHVGRMSGLMANMIDRLRAFAHGNVHKFGLRDKIGGALVVAFLRHAGLETTLGILNHTFAVFHMIAVGRGGLVLSSTDGRGRVKKGKRHMALEDSYGLASAKQVIRRATELAMIIQAGKTVLKM